MGVAQTFTKKDRDRATAAGAISQKTMEQITDTHKFSDRSDPTDLKKREN